MASLQHRRFWSSKPLARLGMVCLTAYGLLFVILATRRWMCVESACWTTAATRIESAVLFLWVDDWEAIFGAIIALLAALIAAYYLNQQITDERDARRSAEQAETARQQRVFRAARAVTPLALSAVCDYATKLTNAWVFARDRMNEHPVAQVQFGLDLNAPPSLDDVDFPTLERWVISDLQAMVEASDELTAQPFIVLLEKIQVQGSRARGWIDQRDGDAHNPPWDRQWALGQAVESAELYARAQSLFLIARHEGLTKAVPVQAAAVASALNLIGLHDVVHSDLHEEASRLYR